MAKKVNPTAAHRLLVSQGMVQNFLRAKKKAKLHKKKWAEKKVDQPIIDHTFWKADAQPILIHSHPHLGGESYGTIVPVFGDKLRQQLWQCHPATPKNPAEAQLHWQLKNLLRQVWIFKK